jgi:hypothetical protein
MNRRPFRFFGVVALAALAPAAPIRAAEPEAGSSFKVALVSRMDMEVQGQKQKLDGDTELRYTWQRNGREKTLRLDRTAVKASMNGQEMMNTSMSRAGVVNVRQTTKDDVPFDKAPPELQKQLQDSFGAPVCKIVVDEEGKEVKRQVVAGPGAKPLVDNGMIANALLFHPPFPAGRDEWQADTELSMGNGGYARGKLTYRKVPGGKGGQAVKVSGTLTNDAFPQPGTPLVIKAARYVVQGEQTYDPAQQEWVAGKLTIDVSFEMTANNQPLGSTKGTMGVTFERLAGNR